MSRPERVDAGTPPEHRNPSGGTPPARPGDGSNIAELAVEWVKALGASLSTGFRLAVAEAKLAAMTLVFMLLFTVLAAVFALGAWGLLLSGVVIGLARLGVQVWISLMILGVVQVILAIGLFVAVQRLGRRLEMPETGRHIESAIGKDEDLMIAGEEEDDDR